MKKVVNDKKRIILEQCRLMKIRRELFRNDFLAFRRFYFPNYHKVPDASFHKELCMLLSNAVDKRGGRYAIAAPRGSAKSTIVSLEYVVYCICYSLEEFIVIISSTNEQAVSFLRNIKCELMSNKLLLRDFPDVCETGKSPGPPRWTQKEIITRNGIEVLALGTRQQLRGRINRSFRPSLIILDDIETDENVQNPDSYYKLQDWLTKSVLKAGTSRTNVVYVGTIHHYNSLLAQFTSSDSFPGWNKMVYKSIVSWAEHQELWEQWVRIYCYQDTFKDGDGPEAARDFFNANKKKMLKGVKVLWPELKNYYELMVMREQEGAYSFDAEMQNEPVNPRDCCFRQDETHFWDDRFNSEEELLDSLNSQMQVFGACDPSLGRQNKRGDYSAIVTAVRDLKEDTIYILDADIARRSPDKTIEDILKYHQRRKYSKFAFESNQFQEFMASELKKRSSKSGYLLNVQEIKNTSDKFARIEAIQPIVKNGAIQFSKRHHTLLEQMKFFPRGAHDDGLDALEMVIKISQRPVYHLTRVKSSARPLITSSMFDNF